MMKVVTSDEMDQVVGVLASAFLHEEFWSWAIDLPHLSQEAKIKKLELLFKIHLKYFCLPYKSAYRLEDFQGAALWSLPSCWQLGLLQQIKFLPEFIKVVGLKHCIKVIHVIDVIQKYHPKEPHYYLQIIGVEPLQQGKGLSKKLLKPILKQCDDQKIPVYLETATPSHVALYRHLGFKMMHELSNLPYGAPIVYGMWRDPKG